ncbi:hypothetical protein [Rheinheimera sp.]|uniref:hypothetical protein n=1 Tax=Rheinheimera sp. TaxID=1869214 RepID=UPI002621C8F7|nr:hypothetical protein [Rheinheimera sp.]MCA1929306.1 general secretion pathway protein GspB [Rheinheimera sp.]
MKVILSCSLCLILSCAAQSASDPTRPDAAMIEAAALSEVDTEVTEPNVKFRLGLIKQVQGEHMALINGVSVKQGDEIEGYQVLSINRQQVVLQRANERLTLNLFKAMKTQ